MLMMLPLMPFSIQNAAVTLVGTTRPAIRLSLRMSSNNGTSISTKVDFPLLPPAAFTRMSGPPSPAAVDSSAFLTDASEVASTSTGKMRASAPSSPGIAESRCLAASANSSFMSQSATLAPALRNASDMEPAMTPPPPVMATVLPLYENMVSR